MTLLYFPDTRHMTKREIRDWRKRYPSFSPYELDSDDWSLSIDSNALDSLQIIRDKLNSPIRVTSAYRNPFHNKRVGGSRNSQHLKGVAFDIAVPNKSYAVRVEQLAIEEGFTAIGRYPSRHFIHIDMRPRKKTGGLFRWGARW